MTIQTPPEPTCDERMPDFFIVGHAKCGTTALYEMLRRHPQLYLPEYKGGAGKEPWYFSRDNPNPQRSGVRNIAYTGRYAVSREEYLSLFDAAQPGQHIGEASSSYLWSSTAAARIHAERPDARIIAIIREPASFLRSLHLQLLQNRHESVLDFREAVELDSARRENRQLPRRAFWPSALIYSDRVRYVEQLKRYHELFGHDRVLVLVYDDFRADNRATVQRVLRFLEVQEIPLDAIEANASLAPRSALLWNAAPDLKKGQAPQWRFLRTAIKALTSQRLRVALFYRNQQRLLSREPRPPDQAFMAELRRRFKPEVEAASEYLQRDLVALWGYDKIP